MGSEVQEPRVRPVKSADTRFAAALAGQYEFSIPDLFDEALAKTTGFMGVFWRVFGLFMLSAIALGIQLAILFFIANLIVVSSGVSFPLTVLLIITLYLPMIVLSPLNAGFWMICIRYAGGQSVRAMMLFAYLKTPVKYWVVSLAVFLIAGIAGFPAILLGAIMQVPEFSFANFTLLSFMPEFLKFLFQMIVYALYAFAIPLVADRNLGAWEALETSRKAISRHWPKVLATFALIVLLTQTIPAIAIYLIGVDLHKAFWLLFVLFIWLLPLSSICFAIVYREIFGVYSANQ